MRACGLPHSRRQKCSCRGPFFLLEGVQGEQVVAQADFLGDELLQQRVVVFQGARAAIGGGDREAGALAEAAQGQVDRLDPLHDFRLGDVL